VARRKRQIPECLITYYRNSVGGSVLDAYRQGRTVMVEADRSPTPPQDTPEIRDAELALRSIQDEIDAAYWMFSRSASRGPGKLADPTLFARRNAARDHLMDLRRQPLQGS
jgi:hypothetical protein